MSISQTTTGDDIDINRMVEWFAIKMQRIPLYQTEGHQFPTWYFDDPDAPVRVEYIPSGTFDDPKDWVVIDFDDNAKDLAMQWALTWKGQ